MQTYKKKFERNLINDNKNLVKLPVDTESDIKGPLTEDQKLQNVEQPAIEPEYGQVNDYDKSGLVESDEIEKIDEDSKHKR